MKRPSIDATASVTGAVLAILGVFDVASRLGITADELAIVIGAVGTIAGVVRHRFEARRAVQPAPSTVDTEDAP